MQWLHDLSCLLGGALLSNALPHFISGVLGRTFPSPFAKPPGQGLSSSTVNVLWGSFNLILSYALICHVGQFDPRASDQAVAVLAGLISSGLLLAGPFGRFHGGNSPARWSLPR